MGHTPCGRGRLREGLCQTDRVGSPSWLHGAQHFLTYLHLISAGPQSPSTDLIIPTRHATEDSCTAVDLRLFLKCCTPALIMGTHVGGALFFVGGDTPRVIPHGVEVG